MQPEPSNLRRHLRCGAVAGMVTWVWYAIFESVSADLVPAFSATSDRFTIWHWTFTVLLHLIYVVVGLLSGTLVAVVLHAASPARNAGGEGPARCIQVVASMTVVPAIVANLVAQYGVRLAGTTMLGAFILFTVPMAAAALSRPDRRIAAFRGSDLTWSLPLVMVGAAWLLRELMVDATRLHKVFAVTICALIATAAGRWLSLLGTGSQVRPIRTSRGVAIVLLAVPLLLAIEYSRVAPPPRLPKLHPAAQASGNQTPVVLIVLDTVRAQNLSLYGYARKTTPFLREISKQATVYTRAIAPSDMTLSTHASMFTGLYARSHGAHYNDEGLPRPLADEFVTLAELLSEAGYRTIGVVSNHGYLGVGYGMGQGFHTFDVRPTPQYVILEQMREHPRFLLRGLIYDQIRQRAPAYEFERYFRRAAQINDVAFGLFEQAVERGGPFFLMLNYMDAHWPYVPPAPFDTRWPGKDAAFDTPHHYQLLEQVVRNQHRHIRNSERAHLLSQYDGAIAYMDEQIRLVVERLKRRGIYDGCLLIITSDHGEAFGERDLVDHGVGVYEHQVHVPLLIKFPGSREARVVDQPVSLVDLMPTVMDVLGRPVPENVHGRSLLALHANRAPVISESFPNFGFLGERFRRVERAIYGGNMKYITSDKGTQDLFDLAEDPQETTNIRQYVPERAGRMHDRLIGWLASRLPPTDVELQAQEKDLRRLKSLGYLE